MDGLIGKALKEIQILYLYHLQEKKRILKYIKTEKIDIGKKRPKVRYLDVHVTRTSYLAKEESPCNFHSKATTALDKPQSSLFMTIYGLLGIIVKL